MQPDDGVGVKNGPVKSASSSQHHTPLGLRTVAIFEFAKGLIVLIAGLGLLSLVHRDAQAIAENIVTRLHMNPARGYPNIFIEFAGHLTDARLWFMSMGALAYSAVRFIETYGLWHERAWAEWFAVFSAGLYLPVELWHLYDKPSLLSFLIPLINVGIMVYLAALLVANARRQKANRHQDI